MFEQQPSFAVSSMLQQRYRLDTLLGAGGTAFVYRAHDEVLGRDVAVKIFQASTVDQTEIARQENELKLLASLSHHGLVTLLDAGVDLTNPERPHLYLVMELVDGTDLRHRISAGTLSVRQVAEIGYDIAAALEYIHNRGIVHRDVKPANVLLVEYGTSDSRMRVKLSDFGIALLSDSARLTAPQLTTGTAAYLSPEQANGAVIGPASDVYSLGLLLLECINGEVVFPGHTVPSVLARLRVDPPVPSDVPPTFSALLAAMTARDPSERPTTGEVSLALRQVIINEAGRHRSEDPTTQRAGTATR